jgi:hypothetical protein
MSIRESTQQVEKLYPWTPPQKKGGEQVEENLSLLLEI